VRRSDPAKAAREFESANELCPDPWYLGILAVCYEKSGRVIDAIAAIDGYLEDYDAGQRTQAVAARQRLTAMLAKVDVVTQPPGARVDAKGMGRKTVATTPATLTLDPGEHVLDVELDGHAPYQRTIVLRPGDDLHLDIALREEASSSDWRGARGDSRSGRFSLTGAVGATFDLAVPFDSDVLKTAPGVGGELSGGVSLGRLRLELALSVMGFPDSAGYILEFSGGPRVGIRLGSIPLWLELEVLIGWSFMNVTSEQAVVPAGRHSGVVAAPALAIVYRAIAWLEVFFRPARIEVFDIGDGGSDGALLRWGFDVGVRFRL
jgi:hypothetical protein